MTENQTATFSRGWAEPTPFIRMETCESDSVMNLNGNRLHVMACDVPRDYCPHLPHALRAKLWAQRKSPCTASPRRPMPTHAGKPWRAGCAILATICLLLSGCATDDPPPAVGDEAYPLPGVLDPVTERPVSHVLP